MPSDPIDPGLLRKNAHSPSFFALQRASSGRQVDMFQLHELRGFEFDVDAFVRFVRARGSRVAVVCNPNNPDGGYVPRREIVRLLSHDRMTMAQQLASLPGLKVFPSQGNFIMVKLPDGKDGVSLRDHPISHHGVFVRESDFRAEDFRAAI